MKYHKGLLFILIAVEVILSANIAYVNYQGLTSCIIGSDCNIVQKSSYATIFGINVSLIGFIAFSLYFLIYLLLCGINEATDGGVDRLLSRLLRREVR